MGYKTVFWKKKTSLPPTSLPRATGREPPSHMDTPPPPLHSPPPSPHHRHTMSSAKGQPAAVVGRGGFSSPSSGDLGVCQDGRPMLRALLEFVLLTTKPKILLVFIGTPPQSKIRSALVKGRPCNCLLLNVQILRSLIGPSIY
jgi:hypothetical protein